MTPESGLTLEQLNLLRSAMLAAYSDFARIREMARFRLGERLVEIATNIDLAGGVAEVIDWAEQRGRLRDLAAALAADRPLNPKVRELAASLGLAASEQADAVAARAILSFANADDAEGEVTRFGEALRREIEQQLGSGFGMDTDDNDSAMFLIAAVSPGYFRNEACARQLERFRQKEESQGRSDLIIPVMWIDAGEIDDEAHPMGALLGRRHPMSWREFRHHDVYPVEARERLAALAADMKAAILRDPPEPPQPKRAAGERWTNPADGLAYVWIPPGVFGMGAPEKDAEAAGHERPRHVVEITRGFWISETPVTQAAWARVMGSKPGTFPGATRPVEQVSWEEAGAYCAKVGGRLPTEAEWEYAARAGSLESRYATLDSAAWYAGNSGGQTAAVGGKEPNAWGLFDTLGNVWEWVADWYGPYERGRAKNPQGPAAGMFRALRGGSWYAAAAQVRVSSRHLIVPAFRSNDIGFRCTCDGAIVR